MGTLFSRPSPDSPSVDNETVDKTLITINNTLKVLGTALSFVPVAGVDKIVPAIQGLVDMVQRTKTNNQAARDLAVEVLDLVKMINATMESVREKTQPIESELPGGARALLDKEKSEKPERSDSGVNELLADLKGIPELAEANQRRNFFWRCLCIDMLESELHNIEDHVKRARQKFHDNRTTFISLTVDHTREMVGEILRRNQEQDRLAARAEEERILGHLAYAEASYRAADRGEYVKGTRAELLKDLQKWAEGKDLGPERIFVLSGAAGTGKSAVARELAHRLDTKKCLGASFFFVRKAGDLGSTERLIHTIARQLSTSCSDIRTHIVEAVRGYTPTANLESQWEELILAPLKKLSARYSPIVIILDALDECSEDDIGQLFTLFQSLGEIPFPLRVFVTTRPERIIQDAIRDCKPDSLIRNFDMGSIPPDVVNNDIKLFLKAEVPKCHRGKELLKERPHAIDALTKKSEGLFIYARTVVNFLKCDKHLEVAVKNLDSILAGTANATGLTSLDTLYLTVLDNIYSKEAMMHSTVRARVRAILASLVLLQDQVTIGVVAELFSVSINSTASTVEDLRSVLQVSFQVDDRKGTSNVESPADSSFPFVDQNVEKCSFRALHLTFREFLADNSRCTNMDFFIDTRSHHANLVTSCLRVLNDTLRRNLCNLPDPAVMKERVDDYQKRVEDNISAHVQYACKFWATHVVEANPSDEQMELLANFCKEKLLLWFEASSAMNRFDMALSALHRLIAWYQKQSSINAEVLDILHDGYRLMMEYFTPINCCPEQIYRSALSFAPSSRLLQQYHSNSSQCAVRMVTPREQQHEWDGCLRVIEGHERSVNSVKYSTDGQKIVSAGTTDKTVRIWDAITGVALKTLRYTHWICAVDFHPLDPRVAFASSDGTIQEWDFESSNACTPRPVPEPGHQESFRRLAYSDNGSKLLAASHYGLMLVWSAGQGAEPLVFRAGARPQFLRIAGYSFSSFSLSKDGQRIGSGSSEGHIYIWDAESGNLLNTLKGCDGQIWCTKFFPDGLRIVSGAKNGNVRIWDMPVNYDPQPVQCPSQVLEGHTNSVNTIDVTHTGDLIASGDDGGIIRLWDARSGEALSVYRGPSSIHTNSVSFSPNGDRLASGSSDGTVRVWDLGIRTLDDSFKGSSNSSTNNINCIQFSPTGAYVATGSSDGNVIIWDTTNGLPIHTGLHAGVDRYKYGVTAVAFSTDGAYLASGGAYDIQYDIVIWKVANGKFERDKVIRFRGWLDRSTTSFSWEDCAYYVSAIAYSPNGKRIITGLGVASINRVGLFVLWNVEKGILERFFDLRRYHWHRRNCFMGITEIRFSKNSHLVFYRTKLGQSQETDLYVLNLTSDGSKVQPGSISKEDFEDGRDSDPGILQHGNGWIIFTGWSKKLCWLPARLRPHQRENFTVNGVATYKLRHNGMHMVAIGSWTGQLTLLEMSGIFD